MVVDADATNPGSRYGFRLNGQDVNGLDYADIRVFLYGSTAPDNVDQIVFRLFTDAGAMPALVAIGPHGLYWALDFTVTIDVDAGGLVVTWDDGASGVGNFSRTWGVGDLVGLAYPTTATAGFETWTLAQANGSNAAIMVLNQATLEKPELSNVVPEPSTYSMALAGLVGIAMLAWRVQRVA